jgi:hypothetical protein
MEKLIDCLQGMPSAVRWVAAAVLVGPVYLIRFALFGLVAGLWAYHAPRVAVFTWNTIAGVESPNKKRTPKKSRPWERLDDFDDVRVRVSELTQ